MGKRNPNNDENKTIERRRKSKKIPTAATVTVATANTSNKQKKVFTATAAAADTLTKRKHRDALMTAKEQSKSEDLKNYSKKKRSTVADDDGNPTRLDESSQPTATLIDYDRVGENNHNDQFRNIIEEFTHRKLTDIVPNFDAVLSARITSGDTDINDLIQKLFEEALNAVTVNLLPLHQIANDNADRYRDLENKIVYMYDMINTLEITDRRINGNDIIAHLLRKFIGVTSEIKEFRQLKKKNEVLESKKSSLEARIQELLDAHDDAYEGREKKKQKVKRLEKELKEVTVKLNQYETMVKDWEEKINILKKSIEPYGDCFTMKILKDYTKTVFKDGWLTESKAKWKNNIRDVLKRFQSDTTPPPQQH